MVKKRKKRRGSKKVKKLQMRAGIITGAAVLLIYLAGAFYYNWHFYQGTTINGVKSSNMSVEKAENVISKEVREYTLTIEERNNVSEQIKGSDIGLKIYFDGGLDSLKEKQSGLLWPIALFKKHDYEIGTMLDYDKDLLDSFYNYLQCFDEDKIVAPKDAHISEYENGSYHIVDAEQGNLVKKEEFYEIIKQKILAMEPTVSIEEEGCYEAPALIADNESLKKAVDRLNHLVSSEIVYEFDDDKEVVDGERIHKWLTVDDNYNVSLDETKVKEFIDYIGKTYNTFGQVRTLKTSYGKTIEISGGDYGYWLDRSTELKELMEAIEAGTKGVREPVYFQTAAHYGKDDVGDTYVEINLTAQHLFFYKDGELVIESDFVSGNIKKEYGTPVGTYPIQYRQRNATLVGEDYETPVSYWMPFNGNIGMHDAPWRREFGKDIYMTNGSHGCINLPPNVAKTIYEGIARGVGVYVYELPGTETYTAKPNTNPTDITMPNNNTIPNNTVEDGTTLNNTEQNNTMQTN